MADASEAAASARETAEATQNRLGALLIAGGLAMEEVVQQLGALETQTFTLQVPINEEIPIETTIVFDEEFVIPIQTTVPIRTTITVPLRLGPLGEYPIEVPIQTDVPIDLSVTVPVRKEIPIETTVPIRLNVPVTLSLEDTPLAEQLAAWRTSLEATLTSLSGAPAP